jgi:hypothetical protein
MNAIARLGTRERLKAYLAKRYDMRLHMSMILAATCAVGMLSSALLLRAGVHDMRVRYPIVLILAYLTFLGGVWVWLRAMGFLRGAKDSKRSSLLDGVDFVSGGGSSSGGSVGSSIGRIGGGIGRGGGSFDGGGASASFAEGNVPMPAVTMNPAAPSIAAESSGDGADIGKAISKIGDIGGGDDFGAIILLILLAVAIFLASGYIIWMGPEIFTEAAFGAMLAGGLAKHARNDNASGWVEGVVKKTWWPFAIVFVLATVFAFYSAMNHPEAKTFKETLHAAVQ